MGHGNAVHKHQGRCNDSPHRAQCDAGRLARDERIAAEARRLRALPEGHRWAVIREAQGRAGRDDGAMLTLAAAAELYTLEWRRMRR